uniref:Uncharacterized protein n=1 Tax=Parascaris univalens TaxID=6257 RepID=A0A914ZLC9_PARUN
MMASTFAKFHGKLCLSVPKIQSKVRTSAAVAQHHATRTPQRVHTNGETTPAVPSFELKSPFDVSSDIRRAPIKKPWRRTGAQYKPFIGFPSMPTNKIVNDFIFPTFIDEASSAEADYQESDAPAKLSYPDGTLTFRPENNRPIEMRPQIAFDTLDRENAPSSARPNSVKGEYIDNGRSANDNMLESPSPSSPSHPGFWFEEIVPMSNPQNGVNAKQHDSDTSETLMRSAAAIRSAPTSKEPSNVSESKPRTILVSTEATSPTQSTNKEETFSEYEVEHFSENGLMEEYSEPDYATYDPLKFYHTPPPKRPSLNEKILTFCTKEIAIRDSNNLVIACGSDSEVWLPHRCPAGSECFLSSDSLYRICCAVADAVSYTK